MKKGLLIIFFLPLIGFAQIGGQSVYGILNLTGSAHVQALGGELIGRPTHDLNLAFENPSLLRQDMAGDLSLNWTGYFAGIKYGNLAHAIRTKKRGTLGVNLRFINYGTFDQANGLGQITGEFSAGDYVLEAAYSLELDSSTRIGVKPEFVYSYIEDYKSFGIALTTGLYHRFKNDLDAGFVIRHAGFQLSAYSDTKEPLPFEILASFSKDLEHAPFRWHITLHNLQKYDLTYSDPSRISRDPITGEVIVDEIGFGDNLLRHAIIGLEIFPEGNLSARVSYNHQRKQELKRELYGRNVGWSWGLGMRFKRFEIQYARARYHLAGASNHFTLLTRLNRLYD